MIRVIDQLDDLPAVLAFSNSIFDITEDSDQNGKIARWLEMWSKGVVLVAEDEGGRIESFLFLIKKSWPSNNLFQQSWHIWLCGTSPSCRGKGMMLRLLEHGLLLCDRSHSTVLTVATLPERFTNMARFIQAQGFQEFSSKTERAFGQDYRKIECYKHF